MLTTSERTPQSLSTQPMRAIIDSIHLRLEGPRDLTRSLVGRLIFLGLLDTLWGLLITIASVGEIIGGRSAGSDAAVMFAVLKNRLQVPPDGMATNFSTALFSPACSRAGCRRDGIERENPTARGPILDDSPAARGAIGQEAADTFLLEAGTVQVDLQPMLHTPDRRLGPGLIDLLSARTAKRFYTAG